MPPSAEKKQEWKDRIRLQKESGQSVSQWCLEKKVSYDAMIYWRKRLGVAPSRTIARSSFQELPGLSEETTIKIEFQRVQIHLPKNLDPISLMKYLRVLKGES